MVYTGGPRASGGVDEAHGVCMRCRHALYSKHVAPGEWWWLCMQAARPQHLFQPEEDCAWHEAADLSHWSQRAPRAA